MNLPELLRRAYSGKIDHAELSQVVRMLTSGQSTDVYILIQILGRAGSPKYREIVEPFLRDVGNPQLSALAVQVLCSPWRLAHDYREELLNFLKCADWDIEDYVKLAAISAVVEHVRENSDGELLLIIFNTFSDEEERPLIRGAAYCALCRSEGVEWKDMVPIPKLITPATQIDQSVLERIELKLGRRRTQ